MGRNRGNKRNKKKAEREAKTEESCLSSSSNSLSSSSSSLSSSSSVSSSSSASSSFSSSSSSSLSSSYSLSSSSSSSSNSSASLTSSAPSSSSFSSGYLSSPNSYVTIPGDHVHVHISLDNYNRCNVNEKNELERIAKTGERKYDYSHGIVVLKLGGELKMHKRRQIKDQIRKGSSRHWRLVCWRQTDEINPQHIRCVYFVRYEGTEYDRENYGFRREWVKWVRPKSKRSAWTEIL